MNRLRTWILGAALVAALVPAIAADAEEPRPQRTPPPASSSRCACNADCPAGKICLAGACRAPCAVTCVRYEPVCGSDGQTYGCGSADAACHGVKVLFEGECRNNCRSDRSCPGGSVCEPLPDCPDPCGCAAFCRVCACPEDGDKVCGSDGRTYANACLARCAHVTVAAKDACPEDRSPR